MVQGENGGISRIRRSAAGIPVEKTARSAMCTAWRAVFAADSGRPSDPYTRKVPPPKTHRKRNLTKINVFFIGDV